jgi:hypothetical protein
MNQDLFVLFCLLLAALDAYVLVELYDFLCLVARDGELGVCLEPQVSNKWLSPSKNEKRRNKAAKKAHKVDWGCGLLPQFW